MSENNPVRPNLGLPIVLLALIIIMLVLGFWVVRLLSAPRPAELLAENPTSTASSTATPSVTPSITPTPSRTPRPSWTLRPKPSTTATDTSTPTTTPTVTRLPTITPALPYKYNDLYDLPPWTADAADRAATLLRGFPDAFFPVLEKRSDPAYSAAFRYAVYAYREALLRFPGDPRAEVWQWNLTYSLARVGDPQAADRYAQFIQAALKQGSLRIQDLPEWFSFHEPNLKLSLYQIPPEPGQLSQGLVLLEEAGISFWLVETPGDILVFPLVRIANFQPGQQSSHLEADLNGDGLPEIILFQVNPTQPAETTPKAFTLKDNSLIELPVQASLPLDLQTDFKVSLATNKEQEFTVQYTAFPACEVKVRQAYHWDGVDFVPSNPEFQIDPQPDLLQYCEAVITHSINVWKPEVTEAFLQAILPGWPPALDPDGRPYPGDARDKLRYEIGLYQALTGNQSGAIQTLDDLLASPVDPQSQWLEASRLFLLGYKSPRDIYRACQPAPLCDVRAALRLLVTSSAEVDPAAAQEYLRLSGVPIGSAGIFDFDGDGVEERWITIRHQAGQDLEFWILANSPPGVQAIFVESVQVGRPLLYYSVASSSIPPVIQYKAGRGFQLEEQVKTGELYITHTAVAVPLTTYTRDSLNQAVEAILSGVDPRLVRDDLETVLKSGRFNCKTHQICDRFYYTLALAYELAGDERQAVDTYIKLWWENKNSPYTTIARLKLRFNPRATSTPPPTRTPTVTLTSKPTVKPTSTATFTPGPSPTISLTPTSGTTPYP